LAGPSGVCGGGGGERGHRTGLVDALLEDLPVGRLLVAEQQPGVDRLVALAARRVDLELAEQAVYAERAGLVGDDRHDPRADVRVAHEVAQQAGERAGGRRRHVVARPNEKLAVGVLTG
jgi:hypothetical protein